MPKLGPAPTVSAFATAFRDGFESALSTAAGSDARLAVAEARRLLNSGSPYGDNAVNYLERTGQQSVSVRKLLARAEAYALAKGEEVAGGNGRISLVEARMLPADLQDNFFVLRGKAAEGEPAATLAPGFRSKLDALLADRWVTMDAVVKLVEEGLSGTAHERAAFAAAVVSYSKSHPGSADRAQLEAISASVYGAATGHLYPPGEEAAYAAKLVGMSMSSLEALFSDHSAAIMEMASEPKMLTKPYFQALRESTRMINEAVVAKAPHKHTMLKLLIGDANAMWGDESIMDGLAKVDYAEASPNANYAALVEKALRRNLSGERFTPVRVTGPAGVSDATLRDIAVVISQKAMAYSKEDDVPFRLLQLGDIVEQLGSRQDLRITAATAEAGDIDDPDATLREAFMYLLYNAKTGQQARFFVYENSLNP